LPFYINPLGRRTFGCHHRLRARAVYSFASLLVAALLAYAAFSENDLTRLPYKPFWSKWPSGRLREPPVLKGFMQEHRPLPTDYQEFNDVALRKLHVCLATETCSENQAKVVIFNSQWFREGVAEKWKGGEGKSDFPTGYGTHLVRIDLVDLRMAQVFGPNPWYDSSRHTDRPTSS
jgi:hypothetical protein